MSASYYQILQSRTSEKEVRSNKDWKNFDYWKMGKIYNKNIFLIKIPEDLTKYNESIAKLEDANIFLIPNYFFKKIISLAYKLKIENLSVDYNETDDEIINELNLSINSPQKFEELLNEAELIIKKISFFHNKNKMIIHDNGIVWILLINNNLEVEIQFLNNWISLFEKN